MSCRNDVGTKANEDYDMRGNQVSPAECAELVYVEVTSRKSAICWRAVSRSRMSSSRKPGLIKRYEPPCPEIHERAYVYHHLCCGDSLFGAWARIGTDKVTDYGNPLLLHVSVTQAERAARSMQTIDTYRDLRPVCPRKQTFDAAMSGVGGEPVVLLGIR